MFPLLTLQQERRIFLQICIWVILMISVKLVVNNLSLIIYICKQKLLILALCFMR